MMPSIVKAIINSGENIFTFAALWGLIYIGLPMRLAATVDFMRLFLF